MALLPEEEVEEEEEQRTHDLIASSCDSSLLVHKGDADEEICALMQFYSNLPSYEELVHLPPSLLHPPPSSLPSSSSSSASTSTSTSTSTTAHTSSRQNDLPVSCPSWNCPNQITPITTVHNNNDNHHKPAINVQESTQDTSTGLTLDGYKWRKYGKKILKSSPFERNYYKCIMLNCPARKYVDCSFDSTITFTSYEGTHDNLSCLKSNATRVHCNTGPWNS